MDEVRIVDVRERLLDDDGVEQRIRALLRLRVDVVVVVVVVVVLLIRNDLGFLYVGSWSVIVAPSERRRQRICNARVEALG